MSLRQPIVRIAPVVLALGLLALPGCGKIQSLIGGDEEGGDAGEDQAKAEEGAPSEAPAKAEESGEPTADAEPAVDCPEGAAAKGAAPPAGTEQWCERAPVEGQLPVRHGRWARWHQNGQLAQEIHYQEGAKHGPSASWYENGQKAEAGEYQAGETQGTWNKWNEDGQKLSQVEYTAGKKNGKSIHWYENGTKREELVYKDNVEHGSLVEWHEGGQKVRAGNYVEGKKDGKWEEWDQSGNLLGSETWKLGALEATACAGNGEQKGAAPPKGREQWCEIDGKRQGPYEEWFESGKLMRQGQYLDDQKDGRWAMFFETGQRRNETNYVHGKRQGEFHGWHDNGQERIEGEYFKGQRQGVWRYWYRNGQKEAEGEFKRDDKHGQWTHWWKNGQMQSEIEYFEGHKHGPAKYWYEDGKPQAAGEYVDGERHGEWSEWDEASGEEREVNYVKGKPSEGGRPPRRKDDEPSEGSEGSDSPSAPKPPPIIPSTDEDVLTKLPEVGAITIALPLEFQIDLINMDSEELLPAYELIGPDFTLLVEYPEAGFFGLDEEKGMIERGSTKIEFIHTGGSGKDFVIIYRSGGVLYVQVQRESLEVACWAGDIEDEDLAHHAAAICETLAKG